MNIKTLSKRTPHMLLAFLFIILLASACSGLAGEPELVVTFAPEPTESPNPASPPSIARGAAIFAERCVECHGVNGDGQGNLVVQGGIPAAADFTNPDTARNQTPLNLFTTITRGRIDNMMPPWEEALSKQERWDVAMYVYTLQYSPEQQAMGEQVWNDAGGRSSGAIGDLSNINESIFISDLALHDSLDDYLDGDLSALSDEERWAAVAYGRSLALSTETDTDVPLPAATEEAVARTGTIQGTILQGTTNGETVPEGLQVLLRFGTSSQDIQFAETVSDADGRYIFDDMPASAGYAYDVVVRYREQFFFSEVARSDGQTTSFDMPVTIYDLTDDDSVITITNIELVIEALSVPELGDGLRVSQVMRYSNSSDRVYTNTETVEGAFPSLLVFVPPGALILNSPDNPRYIIAQEQSALIDTLPVMPGDEHEILVDYFLPYEEGAIFEQQLNNRLDGTVSVQIASNALQIAADGLQKITLPEGHVQLTAYEGTMTVESGDNLSFEITGNPFVAPPAASASIIDSDSLVPMILIIVGLMLLGVGIVVFRRGGNRQQAEIGRLVQQIAQLDAMHDAGQINHDVYQRQRSELKEQLAQLMQTTTTDVPEAN